MTNSYLQSLGRTLRQTREGRGLSLEQAEFETRIRAKFLVAMENGDLSNMPSRVQARGFLYNYAQYLGLDKKSSMKSCARMSWKSGSARNPLDLIVLT